MCENILGSCWYTLRFNPQHKCPFDIFCLLHRENILVLDIFFEALNYEKIEQKKAYEIAGLLGKIHTLSELAAVTHFRSGYTLRSRLSQTHYCIWCFFFQRSALSRPGHLCCDKKQLFSHVFVSLLPGDIGGQMGLFIGASVLTILEIFDYLYEVKYSIWFMTLFFSIKVSQKPVLFVIYPQIQEHRNFP